MYNQTPFVGPDTAMLAASQTPTEAAWMIRAQQENQAMSDALRRRKFSRADALAVEHLCHNRKTG